MISRTDFSWSSGTIRPLYGKVPIESALSIRALPNSSALLRLSRAMKQTISRKSSCDGGVRITGTPIYVQVFVPPPPRCLRGGLPAPEPFECRQAVRFRGRSLQTVYPVEVYREDRLPFRGYS